MKTDTITNGTTMNDQEPESFVNLRPEVRVNFAFLNWLNCGPGLAPYEALVVEGTDREIAYEALYAAFKAGNQFKTP